MVCRVIVPEASCNYLLLARTLRSLSPILALAKAPNLKKPFAIFFDDAASFQ
jgi:hypothetical protein